MTLNIKVFDTILSATRSGNSVFRNSADFWEAFCQSAGWGFNYERLHSLADLEYFFSHKIKEDVIIFSGHGDQDGFHLSNGDCFDGANLRISKSNHGKIIIFSSCLIGKNKKLSEKLKDFFQAQCLFTYQHEMMDRFCFLNESILLTKIEHVINKKNFTINDFNKFTEQTSFMKNMNLEHVKNHPMVMF